MKLCLKRFPCHMTAHTTVQAVLELRGNMDSRARDVDRVTGGGHRTDGDNQQHPRSHRHHDGAIFHSIPFCVALALFRDPRDPASFDDTALSDTAIRAMCGRVTIVVADPPTKVAGASIVSILLKDARSVTKEAAEFNGTPARPLDRAELRDKFMTLTRARYGLTAGEMFERLQEFGERNGPRLGRRIMPGSKSPVSAGNSRALG